MSNGGRPSLIVLPASSHAPRLFPDRKRWRGKAFADIYRWPRGSELTLCHFFAFIFVTVFRINFRRQACHQVCHRDVWQRRRLIVTHTRCQISRCQILHLVAGVRRLLIIARWGHDFYFACSRHKKHLNFVWNLTFCLLADTSTHIVSVLKLTRTINWYFHVRERVIVTAATHRMFTDAIFLVLYVA